MSAKNSNGKSPEYEVQQSKTWLRRLVIVSCKLAVAFLFVLGFFIVYLDAKVLQTFEGQRWQVPAQIYGQIERLSIGEPLNLTRLGKSLKLNGYKRVKKVEAAGQYAQSSNRIIIFRMQ